MPARILNETQVRWAFEQYCEGYSIQEIADALFVYVNTVRDEFKRYNLIKSRSELVYSPDEPVPTRVDFLKAKNAFLTAHQVNWAYYYHWKNYNMKDLAAILNVSKTTLGETFRKYNLKIRYRKTMRAPLVYRFNKQ